MVKKKIGFWTRCCSSGPAFGLGSCEWSVDRWVSCLQRLVEWMDAPFLGRMMAAESAKILWGKQISGGYVMVPLQPKFQENPTQPARIK